MERDTVDAGHPMQGYYDYHPLLTLDRPMVLAGFIGGPQRRVAYGLSVRTGLPFIDIDRWIEHDAGGSLWEVLAQDGEMEMQRLQREAVVRGLEARPPGVLALSASVLMDPVNLQALLDSTTLIYLRVDLPNLYWLLRGREVEGGGPQHPYLPRPLSSIDDLRPLYEAQRPYLEKAHRTFEAAGKHPTRLTEELFADLPLQEP